jgi:DNA repair exonuclease SbcCD nuclease subunit
VFKFLHAADFHLDSAFAALDPGRAAARRRESRELPLRLADYANSHGIGLVLLAGDLFDSGGAYRDTGEALCGALGRIAAPVLIAPGNHDWYDPNGPYAALPWPENVHIFKSAAVESVALPKLGAVVHGAAFTAPEQRSGLLTGFAAPNDGCVHLMVLHGELDAPEPRYDPITRDEIAASRLAYLALGHIHRRSVPQTVGGTLVAWPGCPEGRGFDELGEKGFYEGTVDDAGGVSLAFVPFARRKYEILQVDVTGSEPRAAVESALPKHTANDLYRILLTGETDERGVDIAALTESLSDRFYALELRDRTRVREDVWARAEEDSLRGIFLRELKKKLDAAKTEEEREGVQRAVRFGLAALDHRDLG